MTVDEARAAYEAAEQNLAASDQIAMVRAAREALGEALYEQAVSELNADYELVYFSYDDELSDEQMQAIFDGDVDKVEESMEEWLSDARWDSTNYVITDLLGKEDAELLRDTEHYDELRFAIEERDTAFPIKQLAARTRKLMRYDLDCEIGQVYGMEEAEFESEIRAVAEAVGLDYDGYEEHRSLIATMLTEASYGGRLCVIWNGDVEDVVMGVCNTVWGNDDAPSTIAWENPHLVVLNPWNGSGMDSQDPLPVTVTKPFDREAFRLDGNAKGHGYTWDQVAGVVRSAYDCKVTVK